MADSYVQLDTDGSGKKLDTENLTVGAESVHRERIQIAGSAATAIAPVTAADGLLVNLGTNNDVVVSDGGNIISVDDGGTTLSIDDGAGSITIDGSVSITGAVDTELTTADLDSGAGTDTRAVVGLVGTASGGGQLIPGSATDGLLVNLGTNNDVVVSGTVSVTEPVSVDDNGGSLTVDNAALAVTGGGVEASALRVTLASDSTGLVSVDDNGGSLTVDGTVTANLAAGTNNIGDVDVVTLPAIPAGTNNIGDVDIASGPTGASALQVQGTAAHDAATAGNPVLAGGQMETMADSAPGTRAGTDGDAVKLATADGALYVIPTGPQTWSYHEDSSSALTDATVHAAPGAGLSLYVTDIVCSTGAATALNIFFEESTTKVLGPYYLEAVAGRGLAIHFGTPKKITANTALTVTTSAAIAHSIDVTGFIAPG